MKINLISDIHCRNKSLPPNLDFEKLENADVLVIAGDLGVFNTRDKIVKKIKDNYIGEDKKFRYLVYCWGNHDYYVTDRWWFSHHRDECQPPKISDNHIDLIGDTAFICSTMWSYIYDHAKIASVMNDYVYIPSFTTYYCNDLFEKNLQFILDSVELYKGEGKKTVVVTHHLPHPDTISEKYRTGSESYINDAYCVLKESYVKAIEQCGADLWLHGHSHEFSDVTIGNGTRCVRNPFGYDWDRIQEWKYSNFKYDYILEV